MTLDTPITQRALFTESGNREVDDWISKSGTRKVCGRFLPPFRTELNVELIVQSAQSSTHPIHPPPPTSTLAQWSTAISHAMIRNAALVLLVLLAAPVTAKTTHVRVRIHSTSSSSKVSTTTTTNTTSSSVATESEAGVSTNFEVGKWTALDPAKYQITGCVPQVWDLTRENVDSLSLRFSSINVPGDQLIVSAPDGSLVQVLDSSKDSATTTFPIPGKALKLEFRPSPKTTSNALGCAATGKTPSFKLEALGFEWSDDMLITKESVCGKSTFKEAKCFLETNKGEVYEKARAVMRVVFSEGNASYVCTAWLWGNKGHIVSNNHCFSSQVTVDNARFEFLMESSSCETTCKGRKCPVAKTLYGKGNVKFIKSDPTLDYAVLQITEDASEYVDTFGYLQLRDSEDDDELPRVGEQIYIPQHPGGRSKKIAMTEDDSDSKPATIKELNKTVKGENNVKLVGMVGYRADTEPGSSGSPVILRKSNLVVALHHHGGCTNSGTPSNLLVAPFRKISKDNDGFTN